MTHGGRGAPAIPAADAPKRAWRRWARAIRRAGAVGGGRADDEAAIAAHLARWPTWAAARTVLAYLPFGDEVAPPLELEGKTLLTTRTDAGARRLTLHRADGPMEFHPLGFQQPPPDAPDVDPRGVVEHCFTVSDKALAIGGGVLEAVVAHLSRRADTFLMSC